MSYELRVTEGAIRGLDQLPAKARRRVQERIAALAQNPRPHNAEHLTDPFRGLLRLRVGPYRVSYSIDEQSRVIDVWRVGHRSTFYKRLKGK